MTLNLYLYKFKFSKKFKKLIFFIAAGSSWRALSYQYTLSVNTLDQNDENTNKFIDNFNMENVLANITSIQIAMGNVSLSNDVFLNLSPKSESLIDFNAFNNANNLMNSSKINYIVSVRACTRDLSVCSLPIYARNRALREEIATSSVIFFVKSLMNTGVSNMNSAFTFSESAQRFSGLDIIGRELSSDRMLQGF